MGARMHIAQQHKAPCTVGVPEPRTPEGTMLILRIREGYETIVGGDERSR